MPGEEVTRWIAAVPSHAPRATVCWLVLERESETSWFLFGHLSPDAPSSFDSWHSTREHAEREAEKYWSVERGDWLETESR